MQQKSPSKATFIALIVIVVVALSLYFYFKGNPTNSVSSLETLGTPESADAIETGNRILALLNIINGLKIDASIFNTQMYKSLNDYTIAIPERPVGKDNPFSVNSPVKSTKSTR